MIEAVALLIEPLHNLNKGQPALNSDKYPVLKTEKATAEEWWDSLNKGKRFKVCRNFMYDTKYEVGSIAMHLNLMSANYKWNGTSDKFAKLTKSQQKIIKIIFSERNNNYSMLDMKGLFGLR